MRRDRTDTVAFVTPRMIVGGAERYIAAKSGFLIKNGYRAVVLSEGGAGESCLPRGVRHYTIRGLDVAPYSVPPEEVARTVDEISNITLSEGVNVIEAHNTWPVYYAAFSAAETGIPCLYNLLNELSHRRNPLTATLVRQFSKNGLYYVLTGSMNDYVERHIRSKLDPRIIPIPVAPSPPLPRSSPSSSASGDYILSVCRFSAEKMYVLHLIDGFAEAHLQGAIPSEMTLKIVGDGELRQKVVDAARRCNSAAGREIVELPGTVTGDALFRLYAGCVAYAGMGTTILQAAGYAKPVIRVGMEPRTMPWAWGFWGEVPSRDRDEIAAVDPSPSEKIPFSEIISSLADGKRARELGELALKLYRENYDHDAIMQRWDGVYRSVAASGPRTDASGLRWLRARTALLRGAKKVCNSVRR